MSTSIAAQAFEGAVASGAIDIVSGIEPTGKLGDLAFVFELPIPHPNSEGLPARAAVRATIPEQFPFSAVSFVPIDPRISGFPHQDGRSRALCLKPDSSYPRTPVDRLLAYIASARDWFADAATGQLLKPDDPWELPDFRTEQKIDFPELFFAESERSYAEWASRVGQWGEVQLVEHVHGRGIVPIRFHHGSRSPIVPAISREFRNDHRSMMGTWILLPSLVVQRHRSARTFRELADYCAAHGMDLWPCVARARKKRSYRGHHVVLVGAPIPRKVGGEPIEINWQVVAIPSRDGGATSRAPQSRNSSKAQTRLRRELAEVAIPWASSSNTSDERLEARGVLASETRLARICLFGCGALGSLFADFLVRGAARELSLFDKDVLELGNLPRHTLGAADVGFGKAERLRRRLSGGHPSSMIRSFPFSLPLHRTPTKAERPAWEAINDADVIIDCTANDATFRWASALGREKSKLIVHAFVNAHARMLTLCSSGKHVRCTTVAEKLYADLANGKAHICWEEYDPPERELVQGAGCWHPTFPARGFDIAALAASAVPLLERVIGDGLRFSTGAAYILRRRDPPTNFESPISCVPLVEIAWHSRYR